MSIVEAQLQRPSWFRNVTPVLTRRYLDVSLSSAGPYRMVKSSCSRWFTADLIITAGLLQTLWIGHAIYIIVVVTLDIITRLLTFTYLCNPYQYSALWRRSHDFSIPFECSLNTILMYIYRSFLKSVPRRYSFASRVLPLHLRFPNFFKYSAGVIFACCLSFTRKPEHGQCFEHLSPGFRPTYPTSKRRPALWMWWRISPQ